MNRALFLGALHQRGLSAARLVLALMISAFAAFAFALGALTAPVSSPHGYLLGLVFATGVLGLEFSSGAPHLTLTRPVTRMSYVLSRWAAVSTLAVLFTLAPYAFAFFTKTPQSMIFASAAETSLQAVGVASVIVGLSAIAPGIGDLVILIAGAALLQGMIIVGSIVSVATKEPKYERVLRQFQQFVDPWFSPHYRVTMWALPGPHPNLHDAFQYASVVVFWLVLAILVVNRKQLTYATD